MCGEGGGGGKVYGAIQLIQTYTESGWQLDTFVDMTKIYLDVTYDFGGVKYTTFSMSDKGYAAFVEAEGGTLDFTK